MKKSQLKFLHLSDIHFQQQSELDPDSELQWALLNDAGEVAEMLKGVDGVLVTGDIAFAGQEQQYEVANVWLSELCTRIGASIESVRTIPGNHDVNREALKKNPLLIAARNSIRDARTQRDIDIELKNYLESPAAQEILMQPTIAYNRFAATFRCAILPGKLWWEEDLTLNDGSTLRLRGLHSALLCDHEDTDANARHKMLLGSAQVNLRRTDGVTHLVMCHHPFDWLRDAENARQALDAYASIQLFGHKHTFDLNTINDRVLRLGAGAMQPERDGPSWEPRYNFLGISVREEGSHRKLGVEVWPRLWNQKQRRFQPDYASTDGIESKTLELTLPAWQQRPKLRNLREETPSYHSTKGISNIVKQPLAAAANVVTGGLTSSTVDTGELGGEAEMKAKRKLFHAYLSLSYPTIISIAVRLNLIRDEDEGVGEQELFNRFVERTEGEEGLLERLWDEVAPHDGLGPNPFASSPTHETSII